jgi:hypothetical protein
MFMKRFLKTADKLYPMERDLNRAGRKSLMNLKLNLQSRLKNLLMPSKDS